MPLFIIGAAMLDNERTLQLMRQAKARRVQPPLNQVATYQGQDPETGDRILALPDGGEIRQDYITTSEPEPIPIVTIPTQTPGLSGFTTQKPA
jgi:hypothetical protein